MEKNQSIITEGIRHALANKSTQLAVDAEAYLVHRYGHGIIDAFFVDSSLLDGIEKTLVQWGFKYSVNDGGYIREEEISYEKAI